MLAGIVVFAKERGIEVIPEIDMPGHCSALLAAYPELSCRGEPVRTAKGAGIYTVILCAGKESTYEFLFTLLDEVSELFESPFVHLGGDEAPKTEWERCEYCKAALEKKGLAGFEELQGLFTARLAEHLAARGRRVICWNDILKSEVLPRNMDIQYWVEWDSSGAAESFFDRGGQMVFSDMFSLYFDYPESFIPLEKVYRYEPVLGDKSRAGAANTAGLQACLWTERVLTPAELERRIFPRLFALAEAAWTGPGDYRDFERRLRVKLRDLERRGIAYTPLKKCSPRGIARMAGIVKFFMEARTMAGEGASLPPPETMEQILPRMKWGFSLPRLPQIKLKR